MRRGEWPMPWIWEIFSGRRPLKDRIWGGYLRPRGGQGRRPTGARDILEMG